MLVGLTEGPSLKQLASATAAIDIAWAHRDAVATVVRVGAHIRACPIAAVLVGATIVIVAASRTGAAAELLARIRAEAPPGAGDVAAIGTAVGIATTEGPRLAADEGAGDVLLREPKEPRHEPAARSAQHPAPGLPVGEDLGQSIELMSVHDLSLPCPLSRCPRKPSEHIRTLSRPTQEGSDVAIISQAWLDR